MRKKAKEVGRGGGRVVREKESDGQMVLEGASKTQSLPQALTLPPSWTTASVPPTVPPLAPSGQGGAGPGSCF